MPKKITKHYFFGGAHTVLIYTERDMAKALGISVASLKAGIERGVYSYHAHPAATRQGYQFNQSCYDSNVRASECVQQKRHKFEFDHWYDERLRKAVHKCLHCGREKYD